MTNDVDAICCLPRLTNHLYTGRLFHLYIFDESICQFRYLSFILFLMENALRKQCKP